MYDLEQRREEVIKYLTESFSQGILTLKDYEDRLEKANAARVILELDALVADIRGVSNRPHPPSPQLPAAGEQRTLAFMGERALSGNWLEKDSVRLQAIMSSLECDLTRTTLFPVTKIRVYSLMSAVHIFVPKGVTVHENIAAILSETKRRDQNRENLPGAPLIEISGVAVMSEVRIS